MQRFLVSFPLFFFFSLRVLHLHQLTLPPHCCCVLGWGSLYLAVPRVFAAFLLLCFSLWGCVHLPAFARHPSPLGSFSCVFRRNCLLVHVGRVFFALGQGEPVSTLGMRVRRVVFLCVPLLQWMCAWGEGACVFSCVGGWVLVLCVGGCASPCAGLVLFVGVLVGFAVSFLSWWGVHLPQLTPSHSIGFARVRGRFPVCSAVCVLFAHWGGQASLLCALTCVFTLFLLCLLSPCWCDQVAPLPLPRGVGLDKLRPLPALKTMCGGGVGMAACPALGLLVTSDAKDNTLSVFALPRSSGAGGGAGAGAGAGLALVCSLGGASSPAPMQFKFDDDYVSGWMAFTGPATCRLLLLTDAGHDAVHVIDVAGRVHAGYVAAPGTIAGPRGVAARGSLVAVSAWRKVDSGDHVVCVFEGSGAMWTAVRVVGCGFGGPGSADGQLKMPFGLRFSGDGTGLAVADAGNRRVSVFRVEDVSFARHVATGLYGPYDVEECEGGWLVACSGSRTIEFVGGGGVGRARLGKWGSGDGEFSYPTALALVPGLGLVVREAGNGGRFQVFG